MRLTRLKHIGHLPGVQRGQPADFGRRRAAAAAGAAPVSEPTEYRYFPEGLAAVSGEPAKICHGSSPIGFLLGAPCRIRAEILAPDRDRPGHGRFSMPFTRRLLCQLSYTGGDLEHGSRTQA